MTSPDKVYRLSMMILVLVALFVFGLRFFTAGDRGVRAHKGQRQGSKAGFPDPDWIESNQEGWESAAQKKRRSATESTAEWQLNRKKPSWRQLSWLPRTRPAPKNFRDPLQRRKSKLWNKDGRHETSPSRGHVDVVGAPSSGIELVLSKIIFR
jgi:hypothetical protein